jgi:DNA polymerase-3 subunit epsilon
MVPRQVILDTETTGLEARDGHRIIEVGCLEIVGRRVTERRLHHYVNPERASDEGALAVHGLTDEFLRDKPKFAEIADELLAFVADAEVIIHNASFDVEFLDAELKRLGRPPFAQHCAAITDSLKLARELHPGKRNSLDALCERYQVSNAHRTLHGALLDAGLLADVYLSMTRGQDTLVIDLAPEGAREDDGPIDASGLVVVAASDVEQAAHEALLDGLEKANKSPSVWRTSAPTAVAQSAV